jgi:protein tyrosine phosphatase (PTP) superfamily phosphohydrolase (DUF442 family)
MPIINFREINKNLWSGGQPTPKQIKQLHSTGVKAIINMAPYDPRYSIKNEPELVTSLGMTYHHFPMDFTQPLTNDYHRMCSALKLHTHEHVFVHCAANYRVTVLLGCYSIRELNWTREESDDFIASVWTLDKFPVWKQFYEKLLRSEG